MTVWLLLVGCGDAPVPSLVPTGWFEDTGVWVDGRCPHHVVSTSPTAGDTTWFHGAPLRVLTSSSVTDRYVVQLYAGDRRVDVDLKWTDGLAFDVVPRVPLAPATEHVLRVRDCEQEVEVPFATSTFGLPLVGGPASLVDRTYDIDLRNATWIRPDGVGPLLSLYFDAPVLLGVRAARPDALQLVLTIGSNTTTGPDQDPSEPLLPFPPVPFDAQPFFAADIASVPLPISGVSIPIAPFRFSGTFSPDATAIAGGTLQGRADTRNAGALLSSSQPDAICRLGEGLGVTCIPCADGEPYCLDVEIRAIHGTQVLGLTLNE